MKNKKFSGICDWQSWEKFCVNQGKLDINSDRSRICSMASIGGLWLTREQFTQSFIQNTKAKKFSVKINHK